MRQAAKVILIMTIIVPSLAHAQVTFNRDVRPILAEQCLQCHGFAEGARKAGVPEAREPGHQQDPEVALPHAPRDSVRDAGVDLRSQAVDVARQVVDLPREVGVLLQERLHLLGERGVPL